MRLSVLIALGLLALGAPSLIGEDDGVAPAAATTIAYEDVYRGYLGMGDAVIAGIPAYESAYGLSDDDCLSIAIIAHAAAVPFQRAVEDYCGPCRRSLAELMRLYSVPPETLYVDLPRSSSYPVIYERLYEPYWDGRPIYVVSNADCHALFAFRVSCEFWRCPPPVFFQRVDACGSPVVAFHQQRIWWPRAEHPPGFAPLPPRELVRPARVVAEAPTRSAPAGAMRGSNAGVDPSRSTLPRPAPGTVRERSQQPTRSPPLEQHPSPQHRPSPERVSPPQRSGPEQRPPRPARADPTRSSAPRPGGDTTIRPGSRSSSTAAPARPAPSTTSERSVPRQPAPTTVAPRPASPEQVARPSAPPLSRPTPAPAPSLPRPSSAPLMGHPAPSLPAPSTPTISRPSPTPAAPSTSANARRRSERDTSGR
jgi:hypothetical protein